MLAIMQGQSLNTAYIALPAGAFAIYNGSGLTQYNHPDWLGSARLFSTPSRSTTPGLAYAPFGEGYSVPSAWIQFTSNGNSWTVNDNGNNQTGTLDDFLFRRYSPGQGRWISPDPAGLAAVDPANPQTWNRYAYVGNNPLVNSDPLGLVTMMDCEEDEGPCDLFFPGAPGFIPDCYAYGPCGYYAANSEGGGFDFNFSGSFDFGGDGGGPWNEWQGPMPTSPSQVLQSLWSDVLGLPSGLNCPVVGGLSDYICGGVSPLMDAANSQTNCLGQTLLSSKGLSIALDIAGAIPAFGNLFSGAAAGIEGLNAAYYGTLSLANAGNTLLNPSASGAASTAAAAGLTVASLALKGSRLIPVFSTFVSLGSLAYDVFGRNGAISMYQQCRAGGG
jgi:RHS repeat-associated protein